MNNGLPGPSTSDTITGGKTQQLSAYDRVRRPHRPVTDSTITITIGPRTLSTELTCPICLDLLTNTMTTKECLHRFCEECIKNALMRGNKECPTCRNKIVSKRSLRHDTNFDALISRIWPDRREYEQMQEASLRLFKEQSNISALQQSIEAGMRAQAATRRMRVQGSYDYEKRKRRVTPATNGAGSSNGANGVATSSQAGEMDDDSVTNGDPDDEETEMMDATATSTRGGGGEGTTVASSASETSVTSEDSMDSSDLSAGSASNPSDDRSGLSALSSQSSAAADPLPQQPPARQSGSQKSTTLAAAATKRTANIPAKLPSTSSSLNDKMSKWLNENQKPDGADDDGLDDEHDVTPPPSGAKNFESRLLEMRRKNEEIEVELAPAKSLLRRRDTDGGPLPSLLQSRFIRASPDITIAHIGEYLCKMASEDPQTSHNSLKSSDSAAEPSPQSSAEDGKTKSALRPAYFYILNHNNQVRKIFLHETLYSAFITSQLIDDHMRIFYDTQPPDVNSSSRLVTEIVNDELAPPAEASGSAAAMVARRAD